MSENTNLYHVKDKGTFKSLSKEQQLALCKGDFIVTPLPSMIFSNNGLGVDFIKGVLSRSAVILHLDNQLRNSVN